MGGPQPGELRTAIGVSREDRRQGAPASGTRAGDKRKLGRRVPNELHILFSCFWRHGDATENRALHLILPMPQHRFPELIAAFDVRSLTPQFGEFNSERSMGNLLHYAIVFLVVALIAAFLGFGGVAGTAMEGARLLFWLAVILFIVTLAAGIFRRGT